MEIGPKARLDSIPRIRLFRPSKLEVWRIKDLEKVQHDALSIKSLKLHVVGRGGSTGRFKDKDNYFFLS